MIKSVKLFVIFTFCLAITACVQTTPQGKIDGKQSLKADYQNIVYNNIMKAANSRHIAKNGGTDSDFATNSRLNKITNKLVSSNRLNAKTITPILLKSKTVNAYSLGSQSHFAYVYVTRGLVNFVKNDSQLASVLAHEISHIQLGHHLARQKNSGSKFNKAQEIAADKYSVKLLKNAGYDAQQAIALLKRLEILQSRQSFINQKDYPSNHQRIRSLETVIASL